MVDLPTQLRELQTDFQRIADRAPWVRAVFTVKEGKFGMFGFGRPGGDGVDGALLEFDALPQGASLFQWELGELTKRAGALLLKLLHTGRYQWKAICSKSVNYTVRNAWAGWLVFLLHEPPGCFVCKTRGTDGKPCWAFDHIDDAAVWIDNYPQVCVSVLTVLRCKPLVESDPARNRLVADERALPLQLRPPYPTVEYCILEGERVRWDREITVEPRFHKFVRLLLEQEPRSRRDGDFFVPFSLIRQKVYNPRRDPPANSTICNLVYDLNKLLPKIGWPYEYSIKLETVRRAKLMNRAA